LILDLERDELSGIRRGPKGSQVNSKNKTIKPIILVGGGTGGHIFPLVAIGEELSASQKPFIFVGAKGGREEGIVNELGWDFRPISAGKLRRYFTIQSLIANIVDVFRTIQGFFQSLRLLIKTGAPAVFSKGGYVAVPMVYAARLLSRRVYVHESDAVMGMTNRLSAGFAQKVFTAFSPSVYPNQDRRYLQVGIPIRRALRQAAQLRAPKKTRPLILVLGGIQGAAAINGYVRENISALIELADVVHVTGEREYELHQKKQASLDKKTRPAYKPFAFLGRELAYYYQSADLLISRSGATTVAEGALFGKAMFLIPFPAAAGNHQVVNARILEKEHAAVVHEEYQLSSERFLEVVTNMLSDRAGLSAYGMKLKAYFHNDEAIDIIIREICNG